MANAHLAASTKRRGPGSHAGSRYAQHVVLLLSQRDNLMNEIQAGLRAEAPSPLIKKAGALLTRFWARADWRSREEILRTACWLLGVARTHPAAPKVSVRRARRRERSADAGHVRAEAPPNLGANSS